MKIFISPKTIGVLFLAASLFGCKKKLEEYNPGGTTAETVYTTQAGYDALVAGCYTFTKWWYGKEESFGMGEMGTDLWTPGSEGYNAASGVSGDNRSLTLYQAVNPTNLNITREWKKLYAGVNLCNEGIKIAESSDFTPTADKLAEVHFLRAFFYWHIVEQWGGVHLTTQPTDIAVTTANRTPVEAFYKLIESDLQFAITNLPNAPSAILGKVNKQVAMAFLARVYLTMGYKDPSYFPKAKELAEAVITSGKYKLTPNYSDLWRMTRQSVNTAPNGEVIWAVNYSDPTVVTDVYDPLKNIYGYGDDILSDGGNPTTNRGNNNAHLLYVPRYDFPNLLYENVDILNRTVRYGTSFARFKPTRFLLNLFDETKDARYLGSFQTVWKVNQTVASGRLVGKKNNIDTALVIDKNPTPKANYYTINSLDLYNADGSAKGTNVPSNQVYNSLVKFMDSTRSASPNDAGAGNVQSAKDVYVLRLAEMYLISAEASVMMNDAPNALGRVNELRTVRSLPGKTVDMQVPVDSMNLDFVLNERAREFAGEMIRWFDLKRTGKLIERVKKYNPDAAANIQPFHTVRPIPQQQIDAVSNKSEFTQNPGY